MGDASTAKLGIVSDREGANGLESMRDASTATTVVGIVSDWEGKDWVSTRTGEAQCHAVARSCRVAATFAPTSTHLDIERCRSHY